MALRARSDGNKEQNMSDSRRCNAAPQSPAGAPSSSCSGSPSSSPSARGKGSAPPSPVSSEVVFQRPQAFKGTYRPSDRYERDHQHNAGAAGICHKKNIAPDLEWMYAHRKLDSEAHGKARVWSKLDPTASKGLSFEEWERAIGHDKERRVGKHVLRRLFDEMDINGDGKVSLQECVDGQCFSFIDHLDNVDYKCKESLKAALLRAMRPQGGHEKHERLGREAARWVLAI